MNREHYVSKGLLTRLGKTFWVEGLPWTKEPIRTGKQALTASVLCERHNGDLSPLDDEIRRLHDVLLDAHEGRDVGAHDFDGEDLERWALKVLLGMTASGNVLLDGGKERAEEIPGMHLRILFGEQEMPEWCGFYYVGGPVPDLDADLLNVAFEQHPAGHAEAGAVYGVTERLLDFTYVTSITQRLLPGRQQLSYRPHGFILGDPERGRVR